MEHRPVDPAPFLLPAGVQVLERGWLSANNILCQGPEGSALVDSGYCIHADQTLALVDARLNGRPLTRLLNTHLHSDHCGGNAALQRHYPGLQTWIPPGQADAVTEWDAETLSYTPTGQDCPRFAHHGLLMPGETVTLAGQAWEIHAAPGHDPHAVLLFEPDSGTLISGDALWENGFGVVFPELDGDTAFEEVGETLDLIERLSPQVVIPGHGRPFGGEAVIQAALARARSRLNQFAHQPEQHLRYAMKVLLKFKLLEQQRIRRPDFLLWARHTPYLDRMHQRHGGEAGFDHWIDNLLKDLVGSGAAALEEDWVLNR